MHRQPRRPILTRKPSNAAAKARAAVRKAIELAEIADVEPPDLEPLAPEAMPTPGLARRPNGTPQNKTQRNFTRRRQPHLMKSDSHYIQGYNCQLAVDSDYAGDSWRPG